MTYGVHRHLLNDEFRVFPVGDEYTVLAQVGVLLYLSLEIFHHHPDLVENPPLKCHVFNNVHFATHFLLRPHIPNEAHPGPWEKSLRMFAEKEDAGRAHLLLLAFNGNIPFVFPQIFDGRFAVAYTGCVRLYRVNVNVIQRGSVDGGILVITLAFVVHQAQTLFELKFPRFVSDTPEYLVGLVGVQHRAGGYFNQQDMVVVPFVVNTWQEFGPHIYGRHTIIQWYAKQIVEIGLPVVHTFDGACLVRYAHCDSAAVGVRHGNDRYGKGFWVDVDALAVKGLTFRHLSKLFYSVFHSGKLFGRANLIFYD